jgi:uncharacterized membrane protein YeiB
VTRESEPDVAEARPRDDHERVPGYDVARAIAITGMVLINFGVFLLAPPRGAPGEGVLRWLAHVPSGRASSLFVTLAGVGIARMAWGDVTLARRVLLKRAAMLVGLGATNLLLGWWIDILHFYACYLAIAAIFFLRASPRALVGSAIGVGLLGGALAYALPEDGRSHVAYSTIELVRAAITSGVAPALPSGEIARQCVVAALRDALVDGIHPVIPWLAFLLFGMWLGRLDLRVPVLRRRVLGGALLVCLGTEVFALVLSALVVRADAATIAPLLPLTHTDWSPSPLYVLSASASATSIIALAHEAVARWPSHRLVKILGSAGQLSLSIYLLHAHVAIGIPRLLGLQDGMTVEQMLVYWACFVAIVLPLAALYRSRFRRGPIEWLMRRITGSPAHVAPLVAVDETRREPPRWLWPLVVIGLFALPIADLVGLPPRSECGERRAIDVGSRTASELTLMCPRARFALVLDAPTPMVLTTRSGLDVYLEVRRGGAMIVEDDDSGPGFDSRIEATLGPGRYDVDVRPYSAATGPFVLEITTGAPP